MTELDRTDFIRLLNQLGESDDARVIAAAREIDQRLKAASTTWETLLTSAPARPAPANDGSRPTSAADGEDDTVLIDRLLANYSLSDDTRDMLAGFKDDIAHGEFTPSDRAYLRSLRDRLDKLRA
ncbi:MAG: hypothetical protein FJX35_12145 [Alphaproteobacteria bacterium]|nr:hypothetical protein [Alphaproteobacteria bacterium]